MGEPDKPLMRRGYLVVALSCLASCEICRVGALVPSDPAYGPPSRVGAPSQRSHLSAVDIDGNMFDNPRRGPAFEDEVAAWRHQQMQRSQQYHNVAREAAERLGYDNPDLVADQMLPQVDEKGRMTLIQTSVAKSSLAFWFFILMWRSVMLYELADSAKVARVFLVTPPVLLFVGNMIGCVLAIMSVTGAPQSTIKKRLKALLNMNKLLELIMFVYHFIRLTIWPNRYVPKELYVGRIIHNVLYTVASQTFTKVTWDAVGEGGHPTEVMESTSIPYSDDMYYKSQSQEEYWDDPYQRGGPASY